MQATSVILSFLVAKSVSTCNYIKKYMRKKFTCFISYVYILFEVPMCILHSVSFELATFQVLSPKCG